MIGLVSTNKAELIEISASIHTALRSVEGLKYVASKYGDPFEHPTESKYALRIIEEQPYYQYITDTLSVEQRENLELLPQDWFDQ